MPMRPAKRQKVRPPKLGKRGLGRKSASNKGTPYGRGMLHRTRLKQGLG